MEAGVSVDRELPVNHQRAPAAKNSQFTEGRDVGCGIQIKSGTGPRPCPGHTLLSPMTSPGIDLRGSEEREQAVGPGKGRGLFSQEKRRLRGTSWDIRPSKGCPGTEEAGYPGDPRGK